VLNSVKITHFTITVNIIKVSLKLYGDAERKKKRLSSRPRAVKRLIQVSCSTPTVLFT